MKNLLSAVGLFATMILAPTAKAQTATFDPANRYLTIPTLQVGNSTLSNLVFRIDAGEVISVGTTPAAVAETCTSANFTLANYNAIAVGMTPSQVNEVMGCKNNPSFTSRGSTTTTYTWISAGFVQRVIVYFDANVTAVTAIGTLFKISSGF